LSNEGDASFSKETITTRLLDNNNDDDHVDDDYKNFNEHSKGFDALVKRFELFRRVIEHEDDLLNQRMSWIILAQSFLMAAFISSGSGISSNDDGGGRTVTLLYIAAAVGLLTCLVTLPALVAAGKNIEVQQRIYFAGLPSDALCRRLHGHDRDRRIGAGTTSTSTITTSCQSQSQNQNQTSPITASPSVSLSSATASLSHLLPNTAFRSRFGVPILTTVVLLSIVQVTGWCGLLVALMMTEEERVG